MLTPDQMTAAMSGIRDQILAAGDRHELEAHGGKPCMANRSSIVGYIAHTLGVRGPWWQYAEKLLIEEYDANCVDRQCPHGDTR